MQATLTSEIIKGEDYIGHRLTSEALGYRISRVWDKNNIVTEEARIDGQWQRVREGLFEGWEGYEAAKMYEELEADLRRDHQMFSRDW